MVTNRGSTGGRKSKPALPVKPQTTLIIDNGAYTLKAGRVSGYTVDDAPLVVPNFIARNPLKKTYLAAQQEQCRDFSEIQFRRPVERGFVVNWEAQKEIWDRQFFDDKAPLRCDPAETRLILAEPPNALPVLQSNCDQIVFEEYGFTSYYRGIGVLQSSQFRYFKSLTVSLLQVRPSMPTTTSRASSTHRKNTRPPRTLPLRYSL
jgi:actin-related protein 6